MDALRKAEQQKQQGNGAAEGVPSNRHDDDLTLEPLPERPHMASGRDNPASRGDRLPELPKRMEELDDQFLDIPKAPGRPSAGRGPLPPPPAGGKAATAAIRASAQNLFAAKQPSPPVGRNFALVVGVSTLLATMAIGAYFYWQLQPKGGLTASPALMAGSAPSPVLPAHENVPAHENASAALPPTASTNPIPASPLTAALPSDDSAKPQASHVAATLPSLPAPRLSAASPSLPQATERQADPVPALASDDTVRLSKRPSKSDDTTEIAYAAFSRGEYDRARNLWLKVLQKDARNLDALLGMAALAQQEGKPDLAERYFRQAIEVDPKNPVANAGLLVLNPPSDPRLAESRIKGLLAEQPDSPHLHFSLGILYANESRWAEAQQAFFKAHVADPGNADYLYNLAVSLDHLHQDRLAAQYYGRALAAARSATATFDPAQAETRLQALQAAPGR